MSWKLIFGEFQKKISQQPLYDLIIADPPYGDTSLEWDKLNLGWERFAYNALKPNGSLWLFGSMRNIFLQGPAMLNAGFKFAQDIVWEKQNGSGFHADRFKRIHEHVLQFYKSSAKWRDVYNEVQTTPDATAKTALRKLRPTHMGQIERGHYLSLDGGPRLMRSVIKIPNCHGYAIHPTQKPVDLLEILIRTSCPPDGLVGDLFAGSAAVGEAAVRSGRSYIGFEKNEVYYSLARTRLEALTTPQV